MYDTADPRATLTAGKADAPAAMTDYAGAEFGLFYSDPPQEDEGDQRTWYLRGQNFIIAYTEAGPGALLTRLEQPDEYVVLLPDATSPAVARSDDETVEVDGFSVIIMPPGNSSLTLPAGGRVVRLFSTVAADLVARCPNAQSYQAHRPNIPPFEHWPAPIGGYRIRPYSLDVPDTPGRFGKIFRCTTMMVNFFAPQMGPRDAKKMSPHHHDDFEQCSLALEGTYVHHIRWPWTVDMNAWRDDLHTEVQSPSATVIPPPAIHTSRAMDAGANQLVDIFSPPRIDFSLKPGWVLNADDYPMPPGVADQV